MIGASLCPQLHQGPGLHWAPYMIQRSSKLHVAPSSKPEKHWNGIASQNPLCLRPAAGCRPEVFHAGWRQWQESPRISHAIRRYRTLLLYAIISYVPSQHAPTATVCSYELRDCQLSCKQLIASMGLNNQASVIITDMSAKLGQRYEWVASSRRDVLSTLFAIEPIQLRLLRSWAALPYQHGWQSDDNGLHMSAFCGLPWAAMGCHDLPRHFSILNSCLRISSGDGLSSSGSSKLLACIRQISASPTKIHQGQYVDHNWWSCEVDD